MIKVLFIKDGNEGVTSKWRYKKGHKELLPDQMAQEAIDDGIAIRIDRPRENVVSKNAYNALAEAKNRDSSLT